MLEKFWQDNLNEIRENKIRFTAVCICFVVAVVLFLTDDSGGEEIVLTESPQLETVEVAENINVNEKIITVKNAADSVANENIKVVLGANSQDLFVHDPFKVPPKEKVEPVEIPAVVIVPPVAQVQIEKFILRGTVIVGINKSALVQRGEENFIVEIGDNLDGKIITRIEKDFLTLDDGTKIFVEMN